MLQEETSFSLQGEPASLAAKTGSLYLAGATKAVKA